MVYNKMYESNDETGLDAMAGDGGYQESTLSAVLRAKMKREGKRFWAGDNISDYLHDSDKEHLINEATEAFEGVLDTLLIDRENDPNSKGTARRLAKMYFNEIMAGRYDPAPDCTAFPNDSDAGKKEYTAKVTTSGKVAKDGEKILNKIFNKKKLDEVAAWQHAKVVLSVGP